MMKPFALQARYVLTMDGRPPIENGVVTIADEQIVAVGENTSGKPPVDLSDAALLPGFVNTHTHLEFSDLDEPLGEPGMSLPQWIRAVLEYRTRKVNEPRPHSTLPEGLELSPVTFGLMKSLDATTIGDIATFGPDMEAYAHRSRSDVIIFSELLGLPIESLPALAERAETHLARVADHGYSFAEVMPHMIAGLSPHAPYSVHPATVRMAAELSHNRGNVPLAMHIAESREELELLASGTGPFREFLEERGVWQADAIPLRSRPLDYLQMLSRASRALVIHGNYLRQDELDFIAERRDHMSLVYCPRTHAYFQHEPYPLLQAIGKLGVTLAIGTDSLASNPDLSMLAELRFLAGLFPQLHPAAILYLGITAGAKALGLRQSIGSIEPGKLANLVAIALPAKGDPYEEIVRGDGKEIATWHRGDAPYPYMGDQDYQSRTWISGDGE
jgi:aminodeoxyfutalosine deaminase